MTKPKEEVTTLVLDPNPKGELKDLGGSRSDEWNMRLLNLVGSSLPINHSDAKASNEAIKPASQATVDISPGDPTEGLLSSHLLAANSESLPLYPSCQAH